MPGSRCRKSGQEEGEKGRYETRRYNDALIIPHGVVLYAESACGEFVVIRKPARVKELDDSGAGSRLHPQEMRESVAVNTHHDS